MLPEGIDRPETWIALVSLTAMEIVLGIDNIVFISILTGRLEERLRLPVARAGLFIALFMRIGLLASIAWIMGLTGRLFTAFGHDVTGKSLILFLGGLFLIGKSVTELHKKIDGHDETPLGATADPKGAKGLKKRAVARAATSTILQIVALDLVFSLDSVITAVGMVEPEEIWIMGVAIVIAVIVMLAGARPIGDFVMRHPTVKVLALAFLILIGVMLVAEGIGQHIPKGYIYFAMAFALVVEMINMRLRKRRGGTGDARGASSPPGS